MTWLIASVLVALSVTGAGIAVYLCLKKVRVLKEQLAQAELALEGANNRLEQAKARVALLSNTDSVTGLRVRHVVVERFQLTLALARSEGFMFGIIVLQLTDFEHWADRQGREMADKLLVSVAERLQAATHETDTVGRVREHEIAILVPVLHNPSEIETIAAHLRDVLAPPFRLAGATQTFTLSVHVGSASYPRDGGDWPSLLKVVDERLRANRMQLH